MVRFRLADRASAETIDWPNLGYADAYAGSFEVFDRLQQEGTIPAAVRVQVQYPTPLVSMAGTIVAVVPRWIMLWRRSALTQRLSGGARASGAAPIPVGVSRQS